jgi:hypothetical protein
MIYAKKINPAQRKMLQKFQDQTMFEPMYQDALDSGEMSFAEVWKENLKWFDDLNNEVQRIKAVPGSGL